ncbi:hypothetical protein [Paraburkholderia tagetis]|uniref:Uncharacterized protein n=1 Tax=Paraburkholderia tagetis TaxID=2913261 RepID=A0A9X1RNH1_9BURK|nr:hypothetical protein [Paraburkholderia tagetis]MCG5073041.1 hypothetical protein [Paraburkholderia tagetis]
MLEHAALFAEWLDTAGRREMAIVLSASWPYRFALAADIELVTGAKLAARGPAILRVLAAVCDRQHARLRGSDHSTAYAPWELLDIPPALHIVALRFDPRALDAGQIERDGAAILFALRRELERAWETAHA